MVPSLLPGDRLRVDPSAYRHRLPEVGDVVVLPDPEGRVRWLVKRVARVDPERRRVEVRGDAAELARDSRRFGPVPVAALVGRAYAIYYPERRRGPL